MFNFEKISMATLYASEPQNKVIEFAPPNVDAADVVKVLSLTADSVATDVTAEEGQARVEGRVNFRLVYLNRDDVPIGVDYNADFALNVSADVKQDDAVFARVSVGECDVKSSGDAIRLSAAISVRVYGVAMRDCEMLSSSNEAYLVKKPCTLNTPVATKKFKLSLDDEQNIGTVDKVLSVDAVVALTGAEAGEDVVLLNGESTITVVYSAENELKSLVFNIPFNEEVEFKGVAFADTVRSFAVVKHAKVVLDGTQDNASMRVEVELAVCLDVTRCVVCDTVSDAFSLSNELALSKDVFRSRSFKASLYRAVKINGTATLTDRPAVRNIVAVSGARAEVARLSEEEGVRAEGVVSADVIYVDENGFNSVRAEVPFSVPLDVELRDFTLAEGTVVELSAQVKRDSEIELFASVDFKLDNFVDNDFEYVTAVEKGAEKEQNTSPLSIFIASDGDTIWDAAKALTAMPDDIMEQNPNLAEPFKGGERIVYLRA